MGKCTEDFEGVHVGMVSRKETWKEERCWGFVLKKNCAWQTCGFIRKRVQLDVKQISILCLWGKIQKVCKGCESYSMETSAQACGCRTG